MGGKVGQGLSKQTIVYFFLLLYCWFYELFFHFLVDCNEDFNCIVLPFNRGLFFTFQIIQILLLTLLFLDAPFDFEIEALHFFSYHSFLHLWQFFHISSKGRISTTFNIWWYLQSNPIIFNYAKWNSRAMFKFWLPMRIHVI